MYIETHPQFGKRILQHKQSRLSERRAVEPLRIVGGLIEQNRLDIYPDVRCQQGRASVHLFTEHRFLGIETAAHHGILGALP